MSVAMGFETDHRWMRVGVGANLGDLRRWDLPDVLPAEHKHHPPREGSDGDCRDGVVLMMTTTMMSRKCP